MIASNLENAEQKASYIVEQNALALAHPAFGPILTETKASEDRVNDLVEKFVKTISAYDESFRQKGVFNFGSMAETPEEKTYNGYINQLIERGGLIAGLVYPTYFALLTHKRFPNYLFVDYVLHPLSMTYHENNTQLSKRNFNVTSKDKAVFGAIESSNAKYANYVTMSLGARRELAKSEVFAREIAARSAYSVPGRLTDYHVVLCETMVQLCNTDALKTATLPEASRVYLESLGVKAPTYAARPRRRPALTKKIEDNYGTLPLLTQLKKMKMDQHLQW